MVILRPSGGTDSILPNAQHKIVIVLEHAKQWRKEDIIILASTVFRTK